MWWNGYKPTNKGVNGSNGGDTEKDSNGKVRVTSTTSKLIQAEARAVAAACK